MPHRKIHKKWTGYLTKKSLKKRTNRTRRQQKLDPCRYKNDLKMYIKGLEW